MYHQELNVLISRYRLGNQVVVESQRSSSRSRLSKPPAGLSCHLGCHGYGSQKPTTP